MSLVIWFLSKLFRILPRRVWRALPEPHRVELRASERDLVAMSLRRRLHNVQIRSGRQSAVVDALMRYTQTWAAEENLPLGAASDEVFEAIAGLLPRPCDSFAVFFDLENYGFRFARHQDAVQLVNALCAFSSLSVCIPFEERADYTVNHLGEMLGLYAAMFRSYEQPQREEILRNPAVTIASLRLLSHTFKPRQDELRLAWLAAHYGSRAGVPIDMLSVFCKGIGFPQLGKLVPLLESGHADADFLDAVLHSHDLLIALSVGELRSMVDTKRRCAPGVPMRQLMVPGAERMVHIGDMAH